MREDIARSIFEEIRERPYRTAPTPEEKANSCYFKGIELIQQLTTFGYEMRGRLGEINWHLGPYPKEILALLPEDMIDTHFYPEIYIGGEWKILDPTMNSAYAHKFGFTLSEFGADNESCFRITRLYDVEEQTAYAHKWLTDEAFVHEYQLRGRPFFEALNTWLEEVNP